MSNPIEVGGLRNANPPLSVEEQAMVDRMRAGGLGLPTTPGAPQPDPPAGDSTVYGTSEPQQFDMPAHPQPTRPPNPYAPTGWRKKVSVEFDVVTPSGQTVRLRRLERNDLFKSGIMDHLDQLLPLLIDAEQSPEAQRQGKVAEAVQRSASMLSDMYDVMDIVVMTACVRPMVTNDPQAVLEGTESDWADPNFIPIVHISSIDDDDREFIFATAFKMDSDQLKSFQQSKGRVDAIPAN